MTSIFAGSTPCTSWRSAAPSLLITTRRSERPDERVHHGALHRVRLGEDRVERRDDRHAQIAQELEHVPARLAAEDAVLVLDRHDVDGVDVEEVGGAPVRVDVALGDLEAHARRVGVLHADVVHREHEAVELRHLALDGVAQVGRERRDAALPRQVIAEHRDGVDGPLPTAVFGHVPLERPRNSGRTGTMRPEPLAQGV